MSSPKSEAATTTTMRDARTLDPERTPEARAGAVAGGSKRSLLIVLGSLGVILLIWGGFRLQDEMKVRADANEARRLIREKNYAEALPYLQRWLQSRPNSAEACFLAAHGLIVTGRPDQGFPGLDRARALGYPDAEIRREMALGLALMGKYQEAEPILRECYQALTGPDVELTEAFARTLLQTYQIWEAQNVINRWLRDAPGDATVYVWKAVVDRKMDAENEVLVEDYVKALECDPNHPTALLELAGLYLQLHRLDDAAKHYEIYHTIKPEDPAALMGLAQVAMEQGNEVEAIHRYEQAVALKADDIRPFAELGKLNLRRGEFDQALQRFDQAIRIDPYEPDVHYQRSLVLIRMGRQDEAKQEQETTNRLRRDVEMLKQIQADLLKAPSDLKAQYTAAAWMFEHGHADEGLRWAEKLLKDAPNHPEMNRLLAAYYEKQGNAGLANYYRLQAGPDLEAAPARDAK